MSLQHILHMCGDDCYVFVSIVKLLLLYRPMCYSEGTYGFGPYRIMHG